MGFIAAVAILLRAIVFTITCLHGHLTLSQYARFYDGNSYLITARAMTGDTAEFTDYHGRVFPGYPAMIALLHCIGIPFAPAAIGIDWICAALAAVMAAIVFNDRRIGWAMTMVIPHYVMNSAMALSEAPLLAFSLAGILLIQTSRPSAGGMLLGLAGFIRPMACFAFLGGLVLMLTAATGSDTSNPPGLLTNDSYAREDAKGPRREEGASDNDLPIDKPLLLFLLHAFVSSRLRVRIFFQNADGVKRVAALVIAATTVLVAGLILISHWRGDALASARFQATNASTYGGDLFTWPFHALLTVPVQRHISTSRVAYIWTHAVIVVAACGMLLVSIPRSLHRIDPRDALAAPWLWCNTLFVLCIGSIWGFECFHRFTIPAQPAMFWAIRAVFPRRATGWVTLAIASTTIATLTANRDLDPLVQLATITTPK